MSMAVMYERLDSYTFDLWRDRYYNVAKKYWYQFLEKERLHEEGNWNFTITALQEWKHRFFGVTKEGIPIWGKKRRQYRHIGGDISASVSPRYQSDVYQNAKKCQTEEVTSFLKWKKEKKKLAFIYLGIFWTLEEGETLNDAAKRFINTHQEVKKIFIRRRKYKNDYWIGENRIYLNEIYNDGALVFNDGNAMMCEKQHFFDTLSGLWAIMAAEGFFFQEHIKEVKVGTEFFDWYKPEVLWQN